MDGYVFGVKTFLENALSMSHDMLLWVFGVFFLITRVWILWSTLIHSVPASSLVPLGVGIDSEFRTARTTHGRRVARDVMI